MFFRQALRFIIRNTNLPQRVRAQAQLQLSQMHVGLDCGGIPESCTARRPCNVIIWLMVDDADVLR